MPTRNINLTEHLDQFVERQVCTGRYGNASEIVREALRLLELQVQEREAKLDALRHAAQQGFDEIDQGCGIVLTGKKSLARLFQEIEAEVVAKAARKGGLVYRVTDSGAVEIARVLHDSFGQTAHAKYFD